MLSCLLVLPERITIANCGYRAVAKQPAVLDGHALS
jgi:hypothetical protein